MTSFSRNAARDIAAPRGVLARHAQILQMLAVLGLAMMFVYGQAIFFDRFVFQEDQETHYRWLLQFVASLKEGTFYPRWMPAANLGLGELTYSAYLLYWYLASGFILLGADGLAAIKLMACLGASISGVSVYLIARPLVSQRTALIAVAFAVIAPFTILLFTVYAAFPWAFSLSVLPAFFALSISEEYSARRFLALALCTAVLILSHVLVGFMALLSVAPVLAWRAGQGWRLRLTKREFLWGGAMALGVMLTAFHLLPAIAARGLAVEPYGVVARYVDWRNSFTFPFVTSQIFGVRWFSVQWIHAGLLLVMLLATVLALRFSVSKDSKLYRFVQANAAIGLVALLLSSELAFPLYYFFEPMHNLQWPFRFLCIASVAALLGLSLSLGLPLAPRWKKPVRRIAALILSASFLLTLAVQVQLGREGAPAKLDEALLEQNFHQYGLEFKTQGPLWRRYLTEGGMTGWCERQQARCLPLTQTGQLRVWQVDAVKEARLLLPAFDFPGWTTRLDGVPLAHATHPDTGLVSVAVPKGAHWVTLEFTGLPAERFGRIVSGLALLTLAVVLVLLWRQSRHAQSR